MGIWRSNPRDYVARLPNREVKPVQSGDVVYAIFAVVWLFIILWVFLAVLTLVEMRR